MNWTSKQLENRTKTVEARAVAGGEGPVVLQPELAGLGPAPRSASARMLDEHEAAMKPTPGLRSNFSNDGRGFQKELEATAGGYQTRRIATLRKVDPPTRVVGGGKFRRVIFLANPWLDFAGCWTLRGGRAIFVEAKSTATHRLPLGRSGGITEEQLVSIRTWKLAGAATGVLWQWAGKVVLFAPPAIEAAVARGDKSLVFEAGVPVPRGLGTIVWDFLSVLDGPSPAE